MDVPDPTSSADDLQVTLEEMGKQGWEVVTVLVQRSVKHLPPEPGPLYNADKNKERQAVTEYRIIVKMPAGE
jgi:hypothetical protein